MKKFLTSTIPTPIWFYIYFMLYPFALFWATSTWGHKHHSCYANKTCNDGLQCVPRKFWGYGRCE